MEYRAIVTGTNNFSFVIEEALNIFIGIKGLDGYTDESPKQVSGKLTLNCASYSEFTFTLTANGNATPILVEVINLLGIMPMCHVGSTPGHPQTYFRVDAANCFRKHHEVDNAVFYCTKTGIHIAGKIWKNSEHFEDAEIKIVALHGFMDNSCTFDLLAPILLNKFKGRSIAIVAFDFAGHGWSQHRPGRLYPFTEVLPYIDGTNGLQWAYDIIDAVNIIGWKEFNLLGHSMGGQISIVIGSIIPDQIRSIFLIDIVTPSFRNSHQTVDYLQKYLKTRAVQYSKVHMPQSSAETAMKRSHTFNPRIEELSLKILQRRGVCFKKLNSKQQHFLANQDDKDDYVPPEIGVFWSYDACLGMQFPSPERFCTEQCIEIMKHVTVPIYIAWGTGPKVFQFDEPALFKLVENYPHYQLKKYADCGHHFHLDSSTVVGLSEDVFVFFSSHNDSNK